MLVLNRRRGARARSSSEVRSCPCNVLISWLSICKSSLIRGLSKVLLLGMEVVILLRLLPVVEFVKAILLLFVESWSMRGALFIHRQGLVKGRLGTLEAVLLELSSRSIIEGSCSCRVTLNGH